MTRNSQWLQRRNKAVAAGIGSAAEDRYIEQASNSIITDVDGNEYIDFASGIAVVNTGHVNERVNQRVKKQMNRFVHSAFQVMPYPSYVELAERINQIIPINDHKKAFFLNSGAEAVENAVKIARAYTGREAVIAFTGGFHGRTMLTLNLTGKMVPYKSDFGLPLPHLYHVPFPIPYHGITVKDSIKAIENLFKATLMPDKVAAVIIEPLLGEGGFYQVPAELLAYLSELCTRHEIVLICDEVQTGFARTGRFFASEYYDIEPDLVTIAKGLGGGFVISGVCGRSQIMDAVKPGGLGGTFAGSPLSCVAALEVIDIIEEENLCDRAAELGDIIRKQLKKMEPEYIVNVRGLGCMNAFEFMDKKNKPDVEKAKFISRRCIEKGLLIIPCGLYGNSLRILNPLTIEMDALQKGVQILTTVIKESV